MASTTSASLNSTHLPLAETDLNLDLHLDLDSHSYSQARRLRHQHQQQQYSVKQMSGSALGALVSTDALWRGGDTVDEEDEDDDVQVPDFHYRWISEEEKEKLKAKADRSKSPNTAAPPPPPQQSTTSSRSMLSSLGRPTGSARSYSHSSVNEHHTPPHQYGRPAQTGSAQSSSSSKRVASLTDASTASASSMVPTPPYAASHHSRTSLSSQGSGSGGVNSGDRPAARTYSSRPFQRHVSAPVARREPPDRESQSHSKDSDEVC